MNYIATEKYYKLIFMCQHTLSVYLPITLEKHLQTKWVYNSIDEYKRIAIR